MRSNESLTRPGKENTVQRSFKGIKNIGTVDSATQSLSTSGVQQNRSLVLHRNKPTASTKSPDIPMLRPTSSSVSPNSLHTRPRHSRSSSKSGFGPRLKSCPTAPIVIRPAKRSWLQLRAMCSDKSTHCEGCSPFLPETQLCQANN